MNKGWSQEKYERRWEGKSQVHSPQKEAQKRPLKDYQKQTNKQKKRYSQSMLSHDLAQHSPIGIIVW